MRLLGSAFLVCLLVAGFACRNESPETGTTATSAKASGAPGKRTGMAGGAASEEGAPEGLASAYAGQVDGTAPDAPSADTGVPPLAGNAPQPETPTESGDGAGFGSGAKGPGAKGPGGPFGGGQKGPMADLTPEQREQLMTIGDEAGGQTDAVLADSKLSAQQKRRRIDEIAKEAEGKVAKIVGEESARRMRQGFGGPPPEDMAERAGLSDEQVVRIAGIRREMEKKRSALRDDSSVSDDQRWEKMRELMTQERERTMGVLTEEQRGKLRKAEALRMAERTADELGLSGDQRKKALAILQERAAKVRAVLEDDSLTRDQRWEKMREAAEAFSGRLREVLTPEQLEKLQDMESQGGRFGGQKGARGGQG